jgi:hypothetical protein
LIDLGKSPERIQKRCEILRDLELLEANFVGTWDIVGSIDPIKPMCKQTSKKKW